MTFEQYWVIVLKQWKLILISFLIAGLGAYIGSKLITPLYQSTALVQVAVRSSANNQADYNSLLASDELVQTESQLAISNPVLREVASHYPGLTTEQLTTEVTSTPVLQTQLFQINVLDPLPARAAALANDIAATSIKQQLHLIQQDNSQAQQQIQQDLNTTGEQINTLTTQIASLQATKGGGNQAEVSVLQAQLSVLQQHFNQWQIALAQLELAQAEGANFLRIAQPAQPALKPAQPNNLLNTSAGLLVGLLLGILLAVLRERLDVRVRTPEAVTQLLDWPVLTTILRAPTGKKEDVFNPAAHDGNIERYRILRTNIGFSGIDKPIHSLMVTSAAPRDGKSIIAANLAIVMAKAGKSTLLIDADLRSPSQHELFGLSADKKGLSNAVLTFSMPGIPETPPLAFGMSDMPGTPSVEFSKPDIPNAHANPRLHSTTSQLANTLTATNLSLESFVHSVDIPNLWVMPSGPLPPDPSELLDSKAMQRLLAMISNSGIEMVIFDTPPILGLSDASILASKVDGTLVVVDVTRANSRSLKLMKTSLTQIGACVLGCVVNKYRRTRHDVAHHSYYSYYSTEKQNGKGKYSMKKGDSQVALSVPTTISEHRETYSSEGNHSIEITNGPAKPTTNFKRPEI